MTRYCRLSLLYIVLLLCIYNLKSQSNPDLIPQQVVKDTFYGKVYNDPYRFMEDTKDPKFIEWLNKQSDKAITILGNIPNRETIIAKQKNGQGNKPSAWYFRLTENNYYFYLKKEADEKLAKLFFRKGFTGKEEILFDPVNYKKGAGINYSINYIQASSDASKIVIGFSKNDEEFSELLVFDVKTKKLHPEIITNCWPSDIGGVSWLKDNSGFFYTHVPVMDKSSKDYILNTASVLYKLGNDPKKLNVVFSGKNNPKINIKPADFPIIYHEPYYGNVLIGRIGGATTFNDYYYAIINSKGKVSDWRFLFKKEDKVKQLSFNGKEFYFLSALKSPNYKLCKTNIDNLDFTKPEILVAEDTNAVITDFTLTKSGIYYVKTKNGVEAQLYCFNYNVEQKIDIPKPSGYIDVRSKSPDSDDLRIGIEGWTSNWSKYRYNHTKKNFVQEDLYPDPKYPELDDMVVEEIEVVSHDGAKVPLSIIYKKGTLLNGNNRVLMEGYGAYGYSNTPYLSDYLLHWIREGGIFAVAHVRGGGEKGETWYRGGFKQTKANTWKDFIACTEYLIKKGYTNPNRIAIWGMSAGGILIARAITERPDLFKAAIIYAGSINMLRSEFGPNGENNIKEFGTVNDSIEFHALVEMDACQHVKTGTNYPAVLLQAGANDSKVPVWESSKFAAALLAANTSASPILLSIDFGGGHALNLTANKWEQKLVDIISFALWQTGHPDYQVKE